MARKNKVRTRRLFFGTSILCAATAALYDVNSFKLCL